MYVRRFLAFVFFANFLNLFVCGQEHIHYPEIGSCNIRYVEIIDSVMLNLLRNEVIPEAQMWNCDNSNYDIYVYISESPNKKYIQDGLIIYAERTQHKPYLLPRNADSFTILDDYFIFIDFDFRYYYALPTEESQIFDFDNSDSRINLRINDSCSWFYWIIGDLSKPTDVKIKSKWKSVVSEMQQSIYLDRFLRKYKSQEDIVIDSVPPIPIGPRPMINPPYPK